MNEVAKSTIKARLTESLSAIIGNGEEETPLALENFADDADYATQLTAHSMALALKERDREKVSRIEEALERINSPEFGICTECGDDIGEARLMARPDARLCIRCQEERETGLPACA